jgi:hypothetical protein
LCELKIRRGNRHVGFIAKIARGRAEGGSTGTGTAARSAARP